MNRTLSLVFAVLCLLGGVLPALAADAPAPAVLAIEREYWNYHAPTLEAHVDMDGCLPWLRVAYPNEHWTHVPNFIKPGFGIPMEMGAGGSRGCYFYQHGQILRLTEITKVGEASLLAQNEKASIRYDFGPTKLTWTLTNKTIEPMQYFIVLNLMVTAVRNEQTGVLLATPTNQFCADATFFIARRTLRISGGSRLWAPGQVSDKNWRQSNFQVYEVLLNPKETRTLELTSGMISEGEGKAVAALGPEQQNRGTSSLPPIAPQPAARGTLTLYSPRDYQVFQRQTRTQGQVIVSGAVQAACDRVEVRMTGTPLTGTLAGTWQAVAFDPLQRSFRAVLPAPAGGWYRVEFRALQGKQTVANAVIEHVGVGEVFVGCGQSNSTNCGYAPTKTVSRMVSTFSGTDWRIADDPQPGTHDDSVRGSFWPAFGDAMYAKYQVPIGVAVTGQGGAPVTNWRPGSMPFVWTMTRIMQLGPGGFRAVLWHQGETNVRGTTKDYFEALSGTIQASHAAAGWKFPWFVAQVSYCNPKESSFASTRDAQKQLWDAGIALEGPDTDTLIGDDRDGIHLSLKGLKKHGEMWAEKVSVYLEKVLSD